MPNLTEKFPSPDSVAHGRVEIHLTFYSKNKFLDISSCDGSDRLIQFVGELRRYHYKNNQKYTSRIDIFRPTCPFGYVKSML